MKRCKTDQAQVVDSMKMMPVSTNRTELTQNLDKEWLLKTEVKVECLLQFHIIASHSFDIKKVF
jgi:hypothetical protein